MRNGRAWVVVACCAALAVGAPAHASEDEQTVEKPAKARASESLPPRCEDDSVRLVGAVANPSVPHLSYALVRVKDGTALLSPGEYISGYRVLAVGTRQVLLRSPAGERCRIVLYSAAKRRVKSPQKRKRKRRQKKRRRRKR